MADEALRDLNSGTAVAPAAGDYFYLQRTSAGTRGLPTTYELMGGLEHNAQTVTTADVTGAVGQFYYCTIAGLTADRNLTLPASPNVGERIGVYIVDGDASFELILKGAATVTINGGSAATEWSRLFIANESVVFRATSSTNWIVEYDGRIPCAAFMGTLTDVTTNTAATWTKMPFDTAYQDTGNITDTTTDDRIEVRRAGTYSVAVSASPVATVTDQKYYGVVVTDGTNDYVRVVLRQSTTSGLLGATGANSCVVLAATDYLEAYFISEDANDGLRNTNLSRETTVHTIMSISEVL